MKLYIGVSSEKWHFDAPAYVWLNLSPNFMFKLGELAGICMRHELEEVRVDVPTAYGWADEFVLGDPMQVDGEYLCIRRWGGKCSPTFFITGYEHYGGGAFNSSDISINELQKLMQEAKDAGDAKILYDLEEDELEDSE